MKKILKIGCGCLGIIVIAIVMIFIAAAIDDSDPETGRNAAETESSDTDFDMQLKWEKKGPQKFLQENARDNVNYFLRQNKIKKGFDPSTKTLCILESADFSEREYRHINFYRTQIELKAFMHCLHEFSRYLHCNMQEKNGTVVSSTSIKWGDFDFSGTMTATAAGAEHLNAVAEDFTEKLLLSRNGSELITYTMDSKVERFNMARMTLRGGAAYDGLIRSFLKHHPDAVKLEYSAWSWNEKNKRGEFALALVLDASSFQKAE